MVPQPTLRKALGGFAMALVSCALPAIAAPTVDCDKGKKIGDFTGAGGPVTVTARGTCVENVLIARDDVTITTNGRDPLTIQALDPNQPAIKLDGAHRATIDGLAGAGITIIGGRSVVSATRGSTLELGNCTVSGGDQNGVVANYGSNVTIDHCTIGPNAGNGVAATNTSSLVITNSTVTGNGGQGILASRSSYVRIGQDSGGSSTVMPVTITGNANGISITESSAANVLGGVVENSANTNVFVGRGSSGQIGLGVNGATGGVTVRNSLSNGIHVEGGNATIAYSTITSNAVNGIIINNAGSARIGVLNNNSGYGATTVSNNGETGIHLGNGGAAFIGGTTIDGNGTAHGGAFGGFGISVSQGSTMSLAGSNVISHNAESGIFVTRNGAAYVGDPAYGLNTDNTISGNGASGPNNGGVFARVGGTITLMNATISDNTGAALQALDAAAIELRGTTAVTVPSAGSTAGALVQRGATLIVNDSASIVSATGDGIDASDLASIRIANATTVQGNGPAGVGIRCTLTSPMGDAAVALVGNLVNVTGTTAGNVGCNLFP